MLRITRNIVKRQSYRLKNKRKIVKFYNLLQLFIATVLIILLYSCHKSSATKDVVKIPRKASAVNTHVTAMILEKLDFQQMINSQGSLQASSRSDITFPNQGHINEIFISTGQYVTKGTIVAQLDDYQLRHEYKIVEQELEQANLDIETKMVSLGYSIADSATITPNLWRNIKLEYGYQTLLLRLDMIGHKISQTSVRAPISGFVANLEAQADNPTTNFEKLCTVIGSRPLNVKFPILESELQFIRKGQTAIISPFFSSDNSYAAIVNAINPEVDENGMIWAYARLSSNHKNLLDGMKVAVRINNSIPNQLVVPKTAVVDRQNRLVIFAYRNGKADWTYTGIKDENNSKYAIEDSQLNVGDTIIVTNNFDLSHLEKVVLDSLITF